MEPRDVAEQYYQVINTLDKDQIAAVLTDDCKIEAPGVALHGPDNIVGWMGAFFDAFPDIHHEHGDVIVDGNTVSTRLHITGTHTGDLVGGEGTIPATGRPVAFDADNQLTIRGDRVEFLRSDFDQGDLMRQLGVG